MPKSFFRNFAKSFLIAFNILIAVLSLFGANAKYFNPLNWWFIGFLTLCLPYFLFILIIFFVFWLFVKRVWFFISLITVAFCWTALINIIPLHFSSSFKMKKDSSDFRIMSWNVEHFDIGEYRTHPEIKEKMLALINEYKPDVACFQEMVAGDRRKAINYIGDFKTTLQFKDYHYAYDTRWDFDANHHFGTIIFSNLPIVNSQMISWPPNDYNSIFQYIDVLYKNDTIRIFNIHLQSLRFNNSSLQYLNAPSIESDSDIIKSKNVIEKLKTGFIKRGMQANHVKEELNKSKYPFIICGDFNDVPNSYAYSTIGEGLQNAFVTKGAGFGRTFSGISPTLRIDNIFTDNHFSIKQFTRIPKKLSDHFPLISDINFSGH